MTEQHAAGQKKQAFIRRGFLVEDPPGLDAKFILPVSLLGERLADDQRPLWIGLVSSGHPNTQEEAMDALWDDRSPPYLDALLTALADGNTAAAERLVTFADQDPRVRRALTAALERAPLAKVTELAHAASLVGGEGTLAALRKRLGESIAAVADADETSGNKSSDVWIQRAVLAHALLRLDPDATDAAEQMVFAHRECDAPSRRYVITKMVDILRVDLRTAAAYAMRRELDHLLRSSDTGSFLVAAPELIRDHSIHVHKRCMDALWTPSWQHSAILALSTMPPPFAGRSLATLAGWLLNTEPPVRDGLWAASAVHDFLDEESVTNLLMKAFDDPSPSLRLEATRFIEHIAPEPRLLELLKSSLASEPDPLLQRDMRRVLTAAGGSDDGLQ